MSIMDATKIEYAFQRIDMPKFKNQNTQGNQGQDKNKESVILHHKKCPMLVLNGFKVLSDMT